MHQDRKTRSGFSLLYGWTFRFTVATFLLFPIRNSLQTGEPFNPASVQSTPCRQGLHSCGLRPVSIDLLESLPAVSPPEKASGPLPSRIDLSPQMPPVGHQGQQGSCVGWALAYGIRSYQEHRKFSWSYDPGKYPGCRDGVAGRHVFSPAFIYNQTNGGEDSGSSLLDALDLMLKNGTATCSEMPYNDRDYRSRPAPGVLKEAHRYRIRGFRRVPFRSPESIKRELSAGRPVVVGLLIYENFYHIADGVYDETKGRFFGGHSLLVVGYDDAKRSSSGRRGAFRLYNSWGRQWGDNGYGWISYDRLARSGLAAFIIDPDDATGAGPGGPPEQEKRALLAPAWVTASEGLYADRIQLEWEEVAGALYYEIQRSPRNSRVFSTIGYSRTADFADRKVSENSVEIYRIIVHTERSASRPSASPISEGYTNRRGGEAIPGKVPGLKARIRQDSGESTVVELEWRGMEPSDTYEISRLDPQTDRRRILAKGIDRTSFRDLSPGEDRLHFYAVRAVNGRGKGEWSDPVEVRLGGKNLPPAKVDDLHVSGGAREDRIELEWSRVPSASSYIVYRYNSETGKWSELVRVTTSRYEDRSGEIRSGGWFAYVVSAENGAGRSDFSEPVYGNLASVGSRALASLKPPKDLHGEVVPPLDQVLLTWEVDSSVAGYRIYRKRSGETKEIRVKDLPAGFGRFQERFPGNPGELFLYSVRALDRAGMESAGSPPAALYLEPSATGQSEQVVPGQAVGERSLVMPAEGEADQIQGEWSAVAWSGRGEPEQIRLSVESRSEGGRFLALLTSGKIDRRISGNHTYGSHRLDGGDFQARLSDDGTLRVRISGGILPGEKRERHLVFFRND